VITPGSVSIFQVDPPSVVVTITPTPEEFVPAAEHWLFVEHETLFKMLTPLGRIWAFQVLPASDVATIAPELDEVAPTAQQSLPVAHHMPLRVPEDVSEGPLDGG